MRLSMSLELQDIPGQLILALEPFKKHQGNIISVVHHRDRKTPRGTVPVQLVFEIEHSKVEKIKKELKNHNIVVVQSGEDRFIDEVSVLMVGHVVHTDLGDTINRIDSTGFAEVVDLCLKMPGIDEPSSAYLKIRATGKEEIKKSISILREVGTQKNLLVIEPIEAEKI
jgi:ACT domain-containing protein